jgi:hypothetical protein
METAGMLSRENIDSKVHSRRWEAVREDCSWMVAVDTQRQDRDGDEAPRKS